MIPAPALRARVLAAVHADRSRGRARLRLWRAARCAGVLGAACAVVLAATQQVPQWTSFLGFAACASAALACAIRASTRS